MSDFSDLITSKRTKRILTGVLDAIEAIRNEETGEVKDCGIVFYNGCKVIIHADDMNLSNVITPKKETAAETTGFPRDPRRNILRGLIGAEIDFVVIDIDKDKGTAIASRKDGMELRKIHEFYKHSKGEKILARIIGIGRSHVIAEAYGVQTTIPIEEVAPGRIYDIRDYVSVGDKVEAVITDITEDTISLSLKQAQKDPFQEFIVDKEFYKEFGEYSGTIKGITDFGIFVELQKGITALCNYPNWSGFKPQIANRVSIQIKKLKIQKKQINGLIIREL
jgi:small subunit ribosomal protein S1